MLHMRLKCQRAGAHMAASKSIAALGTNILTPVMPHLNAAGARFDSRADRSVWHQFLTLVDPCLKSVTASTIHTLATATILWAVAEVLVRLTVSLPNLQDLCLSGAVDLPILNALATACKRVLALSLVHPCVHPGEPSPSLFPGLTSLHLQCQGQPRAQHSALPHSLHLPAAHQHQHLHSVFQLRDMDCNS